MNVELIYNTPLWVASRAIRKCWSSEDKSDTTCNITQGFGEADITGVYLTQVVVEDLSDYEVSSIKVGEADKNLIHRVGNKNKHASTLEHLVYSFDIDGISRACLQELARHRHASMSVKSTRYTLKELKTCISDSIDAFVVPVNEFVDRTNVSVLKVIQKQMSLGQPNDKAKYILPEAYKTSLVWTVNARALQNFLLLRTDKAALWEIQELANEIFKHLPEEHKYLFKHCIYGSEEWKQYRIEEAERVLKGLD